MGVFFNSSGAMMCGEMTQVDHSGPVSFAKVSRFWTLFKLFLRDTL
jgi:hypothetical protein